MLFRKPNRRATAARNSASASAAESVEDRLLLSAVCPFSTDLPENTVAASQDSIGTDAAANKNTEPATGLHSRHQKRFSHHPNRHHRTERLQTHQTDGAPDNSSGNTVTNAIAEPNASSVPDSIVPDDSVTEAANTNPDNSATDIAPQSSDTTNTIENDTSSDTTDAVLTTSEMDSESDAALETTNILTSVNTIGEEVEDAATAESSFDSISEFAAIDGTGNNPDNPELGSTHTALLRLAEADYGDGLSTPAGEDRPSAREVSNTIAAAETSVTNDRYLTDIFWLWGQFIDHDIDLTEAAVDEEGNPLESFSIAVPTGDAFFDPAGTGEAVIDLNRSEYEIDEDGVRQQINQITAFIDGSVIYGSDEERADALRTFEGGLLKTSEGDLLPYNTVGLENAGGTFDSLFLAGDVRANENVALTAMHTIWVREHNRIASELAAENPDLTDEELYQQARQIVAAQMQAITFNEFLPALLGMNAISDYEGYDSTVDPTIATEFSTAAYRFGHTLLSSELLRLDENGDVADEGNLALRNAFFNPSEVEDNGVDSILRGATVNVAQELDNEVVDDIRNFLFGAPGSGGFDLASLNIQRGRDHGLADYNSTRVALGLTAVETFADISSDPEVAARLEELYGTVDNIDLWVGGLAEDHVPGSSMGETFSTIIADQFERLRDGDRFWYENVFSGEALDQIDNTTLADVIQRNTQITGLQETVFFAPTVSRIDLTQIGSDDVTVRSNNGSLEVVDNRSHTLVSSQAMSDIERVMVLGLQDQASKIVLEGLTASDLPGGVSVEAGNNENDTLVVIGTDDSDTVVVQANEITSNGMTMDVAGVRRVVVRVSGGEDTVDVADGVSFDVDVVNSRQHDRVNDGRIGQPTGRRGDSQTARHRSRGGQSRRNAPVSPSRREQIQAATETPRRSDRQNRNAPATAPAGRLRARQAHELSQLDQFFAAGDIDSLLARIEQQRQ